MEIVPLSINGAWLIKGRRFRDDRGWFQEWFKQSVIFEQTNFKFLPVQTNISKSAEGSIRGIHYSVAPEGQGKLVTVMSGTVDDVVIDICPTSPTFRKWEKVRLDSELGDSVLLSPNLGHAFQAITDNTIVSYLVSAEFNPPVELGITPFCPHLRIEWDPTLTPRVSEKDLDAPNVMERLEREQLPRYLR